jgi:hypothetical protein
MVTNTPPPTLAPPSVPSSPPPVPTKNRRRWPWIVLGVGIAFMVMFGGCAALLGGAVKSANDAAKKAAEGGVSAGIGSQDATADIGTPTMTAPDAIGVSYIQIPVTNNSSGRSNYFIDLTIESADGATQLDTSVAVVNDLEAGQSTTAKAMVTNADALPADAVIRVTTVQRTASS